MVVSGGGVVVIGSMTADVTAKAHLLPQRGQTVLGNEFSLVSGGKGSNQAVMAARLGVPTWMVGCIGDDPFHDVVLKSLKKNLVDTSFIDILPGQKTGIAHIRVDDSANNDIVIVPLANGKTDTKKIDSFFASGIPASVLLLQLEIPAQTVVYAAEIGRKHGLTVILDPAPAVELPDEIYCNVDIITPNETEATALTGVNVTDYASAGTAAEILLNKGVQIVIVTLGEKGVLLMTENEHLSLPAYPVRAKDTTAAGDAFTGTLGACLCKGVNLKESVRYAMAAGALTTTRLGAQSSLPSREELNQFLCRGE